MGNLLFVLVDQRGILAPNYFERSIMYTYNIDDPNCGRWSIGERISGTGCYSQCTSDYKSHTTTLRMEVL